MVNQREKSYGLLPWPLPNVHSWAMMQRKRWDDELRINVMRHDSMKPRLSGDCSGKHNRNRIWYGKHGHNKRTR